MRSRSRGVAGALAFAVVAVGGGCVTNPLPSDRTVSQEAAITSGRGAYAVAFPSAGPPVMGELISAREGRIVILEDRARTLRTLTYGELLELRLGVHDNHKSGFIAWMLLGTVSTISHGVLLIFTAPAWLIFGSGAIMDESGRGVFGCLPLDETHHPDWRCLAATGRFARFPQGLPPGVGAPELLGLLPVPAPLPPGSPAQVPPPVPAAPPKGAAPPTPAAPAAPAPPAPGFPRPYDPGV